MTHCIHDILMRNSMCPLYNLNTSHQIVLTLIYYHILNTLNTKYSLNIQGNSHHRLIDYYQSMYLDHHTLGIYLLLNNKNQKHHKESKMLNYHKCCSLLGSSSIMKSQNKYHQGIQHIDYHESPSSSMNNTLCNVSYFNMFHIQLDRQYNSMKMHWNTN